MSANGIVAALAVMWLTFAGALWPASGEEVPTDEPGLTDVLTDLLKSLEEPPPPPAPPGRRLPFGAREIQLSFAPLVKQTAPAVVNIYASQQRRVRSPFEGDPFFERFFGGGERRNRQQSALGSGVIVEKSGYIVTNNHVIADADQIKIATADGREYESKVLLKDDTIDLAVLKIEGDGDFPIIEIGDSDALLIGDLVLAIGNPFGVGQTTTSGIVSALARSHIGISDFGFFIQTDAAINPGNSGGALINMTGQLVGINTAIYSRSGGSIGIGFAIPSNIVRAVVRAAQDGQDYFERPFIGAGFEPVTAQIAESLGMPLPTGALVANLVPDGPAAAAGLQPGDVVLSMNDIAIEHVDALGYRLATQAIGSKVRLAVLSRGEQKTVDVALVRAPEGKTSKPVLITGESPFSGTQVAEMSPRLVQRLNIRTNAPSGVAVVEVDRNSPADGFGFRPRDIVREVNGEIITSPAQLAEIAAQDTRWWRFTVERDGRLLRQTLRF
jgi:Do/DeqQ family serine protease